MFISNVWDVPYLRDIFVSDIVFKTFRNNLFIRYNMQFSSIYCNNITMRTKIGQKFLIY